MENWEKEGVRIEKLKDFILFTQIQKAKEKGIDEVLSLIENGDLPLVRRLIAEAEKRGTNKEREKIFKDLLKIADNGEIEDLRQEVEKYFNK